MARLEREASRIDFTFMNDYREPLTDEEAAQMERGLRRLLNTPPKPHGKNPSAPPPKRKERPASKGRVHKGRTRS